MIIDVKTKNPYPVVIENDSLDKVGNYLLDYLPCESKVFVLTDSIVAPLYLERVLKSLQKSGYKTINYTIEAGEASKNLENFGKILNFAAKAELNRNDAFLALGGGVVGDLCGFCAASFMRGVKYFQVATTLLATIDSSVGGKTAVNLDEGKNMAGAFHQPSAVIIDPKTLDTLNEVEWRCGLGEAVKYAVLCGGEIFEILNKKLHREKISRLIELCIRHKAFVVETDEKEKGLRKTLNLGHTIGHAIERISNFSIHHGIAVATGLEIIAKTELNRGVLEKSEYDKIVALIDGYQLAVKLELDKSEIMKIVASDKKMNNDKEISIVGIKKIGDVYVENISLDKLGEVLCL